MSANLTAREIMHSGVITVSTLDTVPHLLDLFKKNTITGAPVVDPEGRVVGVVSLTDVTRVATENANRDQVEIPVGSLPDFYSLTREFMTEFDSMYEFVGKATTVKDIMTQKVISVTEEESLSGVAAVMAINDIHRVLVMGPSGIAGIITAMDLIRAIAGQS